MRSTRSVLASALVVVVAACAGSAPAPSATSAGPSVAPAATASAAAAWYDAIPPCETDPRIRCGVLDLPIDHADPASPVVPLAYYVVPHTDMTSPAGEPVFGVPGGPGGSGWWARFALAPDWVTAHHDAVIIDRRGSGASGAIDCPDLQDGWSSEDELRIAAGACGRLLGAAANRYGSGDAALDLEALRQHLGFERISLLGVSYGSQVVLAYAARFPERTRAMIVDSGFAATEPEYGMAFDPDRVRVWVEMTATACREDPACTAAHPDPTAEIADAFAAVREAPWRARAGGRDLVVDEDGLLSVLGIVGDWNEPSAPTVPAFLDAIHAGLDGDASRLGFFTAAFGPWPGDPGAVGDYSVGLNAASWCADDPIAWEPTDPPSVRQEKLDAAFDALAAADAYAPASTDAMRINLWSTMCLDWPAPTRVEPIVPTDAAPIEVPTLVLNGDHDRWTPVVYGQAFADAIPGSTFAEIAGSGHTVALHPCAAEIGAEFLETLTADGDRCAP